MAALAGLVITGDGDGQVPVFDSLLAAAREKLSKLGRSVSTGGLRKILTDSLLKIEAAKKRYLQKVVANAESDLAAEQGEQVRKLQDQATASAGEFVQFLRQETASAWVKHGITKTVEGLQALHQALINTNDLTAPSTVAPKPHRALVDIYENAATQFNQAMDSLLRIGARDLAGALIKAKTNVIGGEMADVQEASHGQLWRDLAGAVQQHIEHLKELLEQMAAERLGAGSAMLALKNADMFGIGRRLPTAEQLGLAVGQVWTPDRLAPLVRHVTAQLDNAPIGKVLSDIVRKAASEYIAIPDDLPAYMASLPEDEAHRLLMELKANSRELAGLNLDAVRPGRVPKRHITILVPPGDTRLRGMAEEAMKGSHTGVATIHWDRPDEMRAVTEQRGIFLAELREVTGAEEEIGGMSPDFWNNRPVLFEDQKRILNHKVNKPHDVRAAEHVLSAGIWVGEITKSGAQEYKPARAALGEQMGLRPGQPIGRGLGDTLEFLASNETARHAIQDGVARAKNELGAEDAIARLRAAHADAAKLVPAAFVDKFRAYIEKEIDSVPVSRLGVARSARLPMGDDGDGGGNGSGNSQPAAVAARR
jgi:hypothetical protein